MEKTTKFETFLDGQVDFYTLDEYRRPERIAAGICFQNRTLGSTRFYNAELAGHLVKKVIGIPVNPCVTSGVFAVIGEAQYRIGLIQTLYDTIPNIMLLTLEQPEMLLKFDPNKPGTGGRL